MNRASADPFNIDERTFIEKMINRLFDDVGCTVDISHVSDVDIVKIIVYIIYIVKIIVYIYNYCIFTKIVFREFLADTGSQESGIFSTGSSQVETTIHSSILPSFLLF